MWHIRTFVDSLFKLFGCDLSESKYKVKINNISTQPYYSLNAVLQNGWF